MYVYIHTYIHIYIYRYRYRYDWIPSMVCWPLAMPGMPAWLFVEVILQQCHWACGCLQTSWQRWLSWLRRRILAGGWPHRCSSNGRQGAAGDSIKLGWPHSSTIKLFSFAKSRTKHMKQMSLDVSWYFTCLQQHLGNISRPARSSKPEQAFVPVVTAVL